jgi:hypothetical protein
MVVLGFLKMRSISTSVPLVVPSPLPKSVRK